MAQLWGLGHSWRTLSGGLTWYLTIFRPLPCILTASSSCTLLILILTHWCPDWGLHPGPGDLWAEVVLLISLAQLSSLGTAGWCSINMSLPCMPGHHKHPLVWLSLWSSPLTLLSGNATVKGQPVRGRKSILQQELFKNLFVDLCIYFSPFLVSALKNLQLDNICISGMLGFWSRYKKEYAQYTPTYPSLDNMLTVKNIEVLIEICVLLDPGQQLEPELLCSSFVSSVLIYSFIRKWSTWQGKHCARKWMINSTSKRLRCLFVILIKEFQL